MRELAEAHRGVRNAPVAGRFGEADVDGGAHVVGAAGELFEKEAGLVEVAGFAEDLVAEAHDGVGGDDGQAHARELARVLDAEALKELVARGAQHVGLGRLVGQDDFVALEGHERMGVARDDANVVAEACEQVAAARALARKENRFAGHRCQARW